MYFFFKFAKISQSFYTISVLLIKIIKKANNNFEVKREWQKENKIKRKKKNTDREIICKKMSHLTIRNH